MNKHHSHIIIIGAGNVGSRHLQGLARIDREIDISVIDPDQASLEVAKERFQEMPANILIKSISYYESIGLLENDVDVAIISTNADIRRSVVEELLCQVRVRYIILEKVAFQSVKDFRMVIGLLKRKHVKAWVNIPWRMGSAFKKLQKEFAGERRIRIRVEGGAGGMTSNAIHHLELFVFLTGDTNLSIETSGLDKRTYDSKRSGFMEFGGTLVATTSRGDELVFNDDKESVQPSIWKISSDNHCYTIKQSEGKVVSAHKEKGWVTKEEPFSIPYQSELTHIAIQQILDSGKCDLTTLNESFLLHKPMLESFIQHLSSITGDEHKKCSIT
jgi:predicted dehydrogenase|tara:strand:+ start:115 stop:1104 length:990 start_codon:yes stop_codon:yes gene_type:complete